MLQLQFIHGMHCSHVIAMSTPATKVSGSQVYLLPQEHLLPGLMLLLLHRCVQVRVLLIQGHWLPRGTLVQVLLRAPGELWGGLQGEVHPGA